MNAWLCVFNRMLGEIIMNKMRNFSKISFYLIVTIILMVLFIFVFILHRDTGLVYVCIISSLYFLVMLIREINSYEISIRDDNVIFTSTIKQKILTISQVEIYFLYAGVAGRCNFSLKVSADKMYNFGVIFYTNKNYIALRELISRCRKSYVTIAELDRQIDRSSCGYPA